MRSSSLGCSSALCRLPTPEPGIFNGDPLKYPSWRAAFDMLIIQTGVPYNGRIYYLQKYLGDKALKAVAGFMSSATTDSYNNAISLLDDRYGDPFLISGAYRKKLKDWPTVPPHDGESLRLLSDFLRQCLSVQKSYNRLNILNDEQNFVLFSLNYQNIYKTDGLTLTEIAKLVKEDILLLRSSLFVQDEADLACDSLTAISATTNKQTNRIHSHAIESNVTRVRRCWLCKENHLLDDCKEFLKKTTAKK